MNEPRTPEYLDGYVDGYREALRLVKELEDRNKVLAGVLHRTVLKNT
jgi:hypothetical protein